MLLLKPLPHITAGNNRKHDLFTQAQLHMPQRPCIPTGWHTLILMQLILASGYDLHWQVDVIYTTVYRQTKAWRAIQWLLKLEGKIVKKEQNHNKGMVLLFEFYDFLFIYFLTSKHQTTK